MKVVDLKYRESLLGASGRFLDIFSNYLYMEVSLHVTATLSISLNFMVSVSMLKIQCSVEGLVTQVTQVSSQV